MSEATPSGTEGGSAQAELYSASLARSTSFGGKTFPSAAATVPLRPRVSSDDSLKDYFNECAKRNSGSDAHKAGSPSIQRTGSVSAWSGAGRGEAGGQVGDGGGGGDGEGRRLVEYVVQYGVAASTAEAMWLDDSADDSTADSAADSDEAKTVFCIPEQLSCFPCAPPVEELEQFCFPELVGVQLLAEQEAPTWIKHWQGAALGRAGKPPVRGVADCSLVSAGAGAVAAAGADADGLAEQRPVAQQKPEEEEACAGQAEEEQDLFIFVLSTQQDGGQPLYGLTLYFDEPSPVRRRLACGKWLACRLRLTARLWLAASGSLAVYR